MPMRISSLLDIPFNSLIIHPAIPSPGTGTLMAASPIPMKAMTLRLNETEYERLRTLAYVEDRAITDVIREAIYEYIQRKASHDEFRDSLERAMRENTQLIAELAKH